MLGPSNDAKIYLCTGHTDMRKGINSLALHANSLLRDLVTSGAVFIFSRWREIQKLDDFIYLH